MKELKSTPEIIYLYNPYGKFSFQLYKPMPRWRVFFYRLLGFEYREVI